MICTFSNVDFLFIISDSNWIKNIGKMSIKEYISVMEGTAPAIVFQTFDSPNLSPLYLQYTALPDRLTEQAGRGWVNQMFVRRWRVLSLLSLIYTVLYILWWVWKNSYCDTCDESKIDGSWVGRDNKKLNKKIYWK